ncbi:MAG: DUF4279 domain-containing protein [Pseudomonadota bacterium]
MGHVHHSVAGLRLFGDDLNPDAVSVLLGTRPTYGCKKGDEQILRNGRTRIEKTGSWRLDAARREPEDLEAQVFELLDKLTQDFEVWTDLSEKYKIDLFCGIFMDSENAGLPLSPEALLALGKRRIKLDLDIYFTND